MTDEANEAKDELEKAHEALRRIADMARSGPDSPVEAGRVLERIHAEASAALQVDFVIPEEWDHAPQGGVGPLLQGAIRLT